MTGDGGLLLAAVMARAFGVMLSLPFGDSLQPLPRVFFAGVLACVMLDGLPQVPSISPLTCLTEFVVGFLVGLPLRLVGDVADLCGELLDTARGQTVSAVIDPLNGQAPSDFAAVLRAAAVALALQLGALEVIACGLSESYTAVPLGAPWLGAGCASGIFRWALGAVRASIGLCWPCFALFFAIDLVAAVAARMLKGVQFSGVASLSKFAAAAFLIAVFVSSLERVDRDAFRRWLAAGLPRRVAQQEPLKSPFKPGAR